MFTPLQQGKESRIVEGECDVRTNQDYPVC